MKISLIPYNPEKGQNCEVKKQEDTECFFELLYLFLQEFALSQRGFLVNLGLREFQDVILYHPNSYEKDNFIKDGHKSQEN